MDDIAQRSGGNGAELVLADRFGSRGAPLLRSGSDPDVDESAAGSDVDVVLVTNVGRGFGRAVALGFGRRGSDVVCADRDVDLASRTAAEVEEAGGQAIPIQADMTTQLDVANAFRKVLEIFGRLGGVVHVATQGSQTAFRNLGEPEFGELVDENLRSSFLTLRTATRHLGGGWVVLVGPPSDEGEAQVGMLRGALRGLVAAVSDAPAPGPGDDPVGIRANLLEPSRAASDPTHDRALVDAALFLGSPVGRAIGGQHFAVALPPPPRVVETLLPEVQAALDASVRQEDPDDGSDEDEGDDEDGNEHPDASGADGSLGSETVDHAANSAGRGGRGGGS